MNSSIVILDSDEELCQAEFGNGNPSQSEKGKNYSVGKENNELIEFANITAPDDSENTFLHSLGLPIIPTRDHQHCNIGKATSANVICIDDDDEDVGNIEDQSFIDLSHINDFPSSPKIGGTHDRIDSSDEEIVITSNKPIMGLAINDDSNFQSRVLESKHPAKDKHLKHLSKDWSNQPIITKKTRSESDATSSSIGIINIPLQKPQYLHSLETYKSHQHESLKSPLQNIHSTKSLKKSSTFDTRSKSIVSSPLIRKTKELHRSFSEVSEITSDVYDASLDFTNDEIKKMKKAMKMREKQKLNNVKSIISDLRKARSGNNSHTEKNRTTFTKTADTSISDISNSSFELKSQNGRFMEDVLDSIGSYTDTQLEAMFEKAKNQDPQALRKVNQTSVGKDALTARTTCCFSSCLDESLKKINPTYHTHLQPAHFEVFEDHIIPMIKFKRYIDAVYYKAKRTMVPCKPRKVLEDFVILLYEAENLLDMFDRCVIQKHIKSIKLKNPKTKFAVWILRYDQYLLQLKNKANRLHKRQVMESLEPNEDVPRKRKKKSVEEELLIHPSDIIQKLLKYEIQYDFSFQSLKGLSDLIDWLIAISYTLSSKHVDYIERNDEFMNLGKVKSGTDSKECLTIMMAQLKGVTEQRAKSFVTNGGYTCIGEVFEDVMKGVDFTTRKLLRTDHVKILEKLMTASNGDQAIA